MPTLNEVLPLILLFLLATMILIKTIYDDHLYNQEYRRQRAIVEAEIAKLKQEMGWKEPSEPSHATTCLD